jgi:hypothetical protein
MVEVGAIRTDEFSARPGPTGNWSSTDRRASTTLQETGWNATLITGDVADEVAELKRQPGENILKFGTGQLDRTLIERNRSVSFGTARDRSLPAPSCRSRSARGGGSQ